MAAVDSDVDALQLLLLLLLLPKNIWCTSWNMKSPRGTRTERIIQSNDGATIGRNNANHGTKNKLRPSSGAGKTRAYARNTARLSKHDTRHKGRRIMDSIGGLYFLFHVSTFFFFFFFLSFIRPETHFAASGNRSRAIAIRYSNSY